VARRAGIALADTVQMEQGERRVFGPRTLHLIAHVRQLPERRMLELAGLVEGKDQRLREVTVRFAARSEPIEDLRPEELAALEESVKVLAEP
jgi:HTH-type transcriptional regulator, competence development regulator